MLCVIRSCIRNRVWEAMQLLSCAMYFVCLVLAAIVYFPKTGDQTVAAVANALNLARGQ